MRILIPLTYYRPHISGLTIYVERLSRALAARGHQVTILTSQYDRSLPRRERLDRVEIVRVSVILRISKGVIMPTIGLEATRLVWANDVINLHLPQLDASGKPVWVGADTPVSVADTYAAQNAIAGQDWFSHWYRDTDRNRTAVETLTLSWIPDLSAYRFPRGAADPPPVTLDDAETSFFPLDKYTDADATAGLVFNDRDPFADGDDHNFYFTSELRYWFVYRTDESHILSFLGDDDVWWVFINHRLAVDLGGIHTPVEKTITVTGAENDFSLQDGGLYEVAVFHAERQSNASSYKLSLGGFTASRFRCEPN